MRKWRVALGLSLAAAVCALPGRVVAKPQTTVRTTNDATQQVSRRPGERAPAAKARSQSSQREPEPCFSPEVHVVRTRGGEVESRDLSLTFCDGTPNPAALDSLSVLARPRDVDRPLMPEIRAYRRRSATEGPKERRRDPGYLSAHVMLVHPGLLERLQKVASRFPGRTIEIVSGHRPKARETSRHHHGRALDLQVQGVARERLRDFLRTLDGTGVGYYPNSGFVHVDVREDRGYWVDRSGPGEAADYGVWPPPRHEVEQKQSRLLAGALADLSALGSANTALPARPAPARQPVRSRPTEELKHEGDHMSAAEVKRIREDALRALDALRSCCR